jgi:hypothetical protein
MGSHVTACLPRSLSENSLCRVCSSKGQINEDSQDSCSRFVTQHPLLGRESDTSFWQIVCRGETPTSMRAPIKWICRIWGLSQYCLRYCPTIANSSLMRSRSSKTPVVLWAERPDSSRAASGRMCRRTGPSFTGGLRPVVITKRDVGSSGGRWG